MLECLEHPSIPLSTLEQVYLVQQRLSDDLPSPNPVFWGHVPVAADKSADSSSSWLRNSFFLSQASPRQLQAENNTPRHLPGLPYRETHFRRCCWKLSGWSLLFRSGTPRTSNIAGKQALPAEARGCLVRRGGDPSISREVDPRAPWRKPRSSPCILPQTTVVGYGNCEGSVIHKKILSF